MGTWEQPEKEQDQFNEIASAETAVGSERLAKSLTLKDGMFAFLALVSLWFVAGLALGRAKPLWDQRTATYLSGFTIQGILALIIVGLGWFKGFRLQDLGFRAVNLRQAGKSVLKAYLLVWGFMLVYVNVLYTLGVQTPEHNAYTFLFSQQGLFVLLNFLLAVIFAPLFEETMFRGVIFGSLRSKIGLWPAAVLSGGIFSAAHFDVYGFLPRLLLGVLLAWLVEKYKSLFPAMCLHALYNGVLFLMAISLAG